MSDKQDQEAKEVKEVRTISVKIGVDNLTDSMIQDKENGFSLLLLGIPMKTPKLTCLGFLVQVLLNMNDFYREADKQAKAQSGGIIKGSMAQMAALGKGLLKK